MSSLEELDNMDDLFDGYDEELDYDLHFVEETSKAIKVFNLEHSVFDAFWLPKSQIKVDYSSVMEVGSIIKVYIPEWLAKRNDLI